MITIQYASYRMTRSRELVETVKEKSFATEARLAAWAERMGDKVEILHYNFGEGR